MLTRIRDLDRLIVSYFPDKYISEFSKTCKYANEKVCDDIFFRNLIFDRYPNTIKYKDYVKTRSYKQYFFCIIYYIEKLSTNYQFHYLQEFQDKEGSPELEYLARKLVPTNKEYNKEYGMLYASKKGHLEIVKYLIEQGANSNSFHGYVLIYASESGHFPVVKYLVKHGANIHAHDEYPLRVASQNGHLEIVNFLTEEGADIHIFNDSPLSIASENGHLPIVKFLIEYGSNIHALNDYALRGASRKGQLDVVKYLIERGANINAENSQAIRLARDKGHLEIVEYLQSLT